jgi:hypothetical protein
MRNMVKRTAAGAVIGGSLLFTGGLGIASAVPATETNDQLVNLAIGNGGVLRDLNVDVASQIAGLLCGAGSNANGTSATGPNGPTASGMSASETSTNVSEITAQARQVDAGQMTSTTCNSSQGVVAISQNSTASSPNAAESPGRPSGNSTPSQSPAPGSSGPTPNS